MATVHPAAPGGRTVRDQPRLPARSRREPDRAQAAGPKARRGVAGTDPDRIQAERSLVSVLRP
jgi:hypothetical protein